MSTKKREHPLPCILDMYKRHTSEMECDCLWSRNLGRIFRAVTGTVVYLSDVETYEIGMSAIVVPE